jgi:NAD(P)-dependent dehydrogenase (short-subunit alcohol dehydrogenase family)
MQTIVVSGASKGIGLQICLKAAAEGHQVIALSRNIKPLSNIENIHPFAVDLLNQKGIDDFAESVKSEFGNIDILINNAGSLINKSFAETTDEEFESVYRVNVFSVASLTRNLLPIINPKGHVVNISSIGGIQGSSKFPGLSAYSSSKGALITLTEMLAEEYAKTGPSFNELALGAVQTEMLAEAFPGYEAPLTAQQMGSYILDFALNGNQFYNGKVLPVSSSTP